MFQTSSVCGSLHSRIVALIRSLPSSRTSIPVATLSLTTITIRARSVTVGISPGANSRSTPEPPVQSAAVISHRSSRSTSPSPACR
jgi:hypothetical protein